MPGPGLLLASADFLQTTAGSENPGTFNFVNSDPWGAITIALRKGVNTTAILATDKFTTIETTGTVTIQDGAIVDNLMFNSDVVIGTVTDLNNVIINGDLSITLGGTYNFSNVTVTGNITNDDNTQNVAIIGTNNSSLSTSEPGTGATEVEITNAVLILVKVVNEKGGNVPNAQVFVRRISDSTVLLNADTNGSGVASALYDFTISEDVEYSVRKSSPGDTRYLDGSGTGSIISSGFSVVSLLLIDSNIG